MAAAIAFSAPVSRAQLIPSWESPSGNLGFYPVSNEISFYKNYDDSGDDRGTTLQFVMINAFRVFTDFSFEFTADYNFDLTPGLERDHYVELSLVKPVAGIFSVNYQRVISSFEPESVNQFGVRVSF
jgi:hypothetical protein